MHVLRAALDAVSVVFVGPQGLQTKLERCALKLGRDGDLQLRPHVLYNQLKLRSALHGASLDRAALGSSLTGVFLGIASTEFAQLLALTPAGGSEGLCII